MRNKIITLDEFSDKEIEEAGKEGKGFNETEIGLIPKDWEVKKLGELCSKSQYGYTTKTSSVEIGPIILRITDIDEFGNVDFNKVKFCKIEENELNKFLLKDGDILIARSGSIGKTYLHKDNGKRIIFASYLVRFKPKKELAEPKFLFYYLHSPDFSKYIEEQKTGVTQFNLNAKKMSSFKLRIPPLPIQQKIVARLDAFFEHYNELRKEKQKAKEKYEQIIQSVIASFIAKGEWQKSKLGEICAVNPPKKEITDLPDDLEVSFVPMSFVDDREGAIKKQEIRKLAEVRRGYTYFKENDVLFAKITPCMENGKAAITKNLKNGIGFGSTEFHVIRPNENILPEFIFYYIRQPFFRGEAASKMSGTAGQLRVPKRFLEDYEIPLPPIEEQKKIVKLLEKIKLNSSSIYEEQKNIDNPLEQLPKAVLSKAFKGGLVS